MVKAVESYINLIKKTQNARDLLIAEIQDNQEAVEKMTEGIISCIEFLKLVKGHLNDPEAEKLIENFLNEVNEADH